MRYLVIAAVAECQRRLKMHDRPILLGTYIFLRREKGMKRGERRRRRCARNRAKASLSSSTAGDVGGCVSQLRSGQSLPHYVPCFIRLLTNTTKKRAHTQSSVRSSTPRRLCSESRNPKHALRRCQLTSNLGQDRRGGFGLGIPRRARVDASVEQASVPGLKFSPLVGPCASFA